MELLELHSAVGSPPQSTVRMYMRRLDDLGLLERRRRQEFPATAEYSITPAGDSLLEVAGLLREWLSEAPDGPIPFGGVAGKSRTKALIGGWSSSIMRAVAARSLSLTELSMVIPRGNYPSLARKLAAMRSAKLVEPQPGGDGRGTPYGATEWLRRAVIPLAAAIAWETKFIPSQTAALGPRDVEAAFLLAIPLISLGPEISGTCRLAVELRGADLSYAGVFVSIDEGRVVSCSSNLKGDAHASASGSSVAWMRQMNGGSKDRLDVSGNRSLAESVVAALRATAYVQRKAEQR
jgi:DNA-binding HxlR family transcriptional regulator